MSLLRAAAALAALIAASPVLAATPSYTEDQAKRGAEFYSGQCAACHGEALDDGQFAPPLKGEAHAAYWKGRNAGDTLTHMSTMMPPTQPGGLGAQAYADIFAYLLKRAGAPAGDKEVPVDPAALTGFSPVP